MNSNCGGNCKWSWDGQDWVLIDAPCDTNCGCMEPDYVPDPDLHAGVSTDMTPCSSSSSSRPLQRTSTRSDCDVTVSLRLPNIAAPGVYELVTSILRKSPHTKRYPALGWTVTFFSVQGSAEPGVTPPLLPTVDASPMLPAVSAGVVLPESDGNRQYWVSVLEQHLHAVLTTPGWIVVFQKEPNGYTPIPANGGTLDASPGASSTTE
jgi:hypothetical protein